MSKVRSKKDQTNEREKNQKPTSRSNAKGFTSMYSIKAYCSIIWAPMVLKVPTPTALLPAAHMASPIGCLHSLPEAQWTPHMPDISVSLDLHHNLALTFTATS